MGTLKASVIDVVRSPKSASADAAGCVGVVDSGKLVSLVVANVPDLRPMFLRL